MTSVLFENMSRYYEGFTEGAANEIGKLFAESVPDGAAMVRDSVAEQLRSQGKFSEAFGQLAGRLADATTDALRAWQKELSFAVFNAADAKAYAQAEGRLNKAAVRHSNIKALWELFTGFTVESGRIEKGVRTTEDERIKIFDRNRGRADLLAFFNNVGQFTAQGGGVSSMMLEFARKGRFAGGLSAPTDYMSLGRLTRDVTPDDMLRDRLALYREMEPLLKKTIEHYKEQADLEARNTAEGRSRIQQLEQQALALEQLIEKNRQYQLEVVGRGPLRSLKEGFFGVTERFSLEAQNFKQVGQDIANSLQQNLGNAFTGFITGAEKAGQAARNFALNVLNSMVQILSNKLAAQLLGGIFAFASPSLGLTGTGPPLTTEMSNAPGVFTSNIELTSSLYASGGRLQGGSGQRDDVPFLGMAGEFVIRKAAVQKYGESLFEAFNAGRVPMFVGGGAVSPSPSFGGSGNQYNFEINVTANGSSTASGQGPEDARERGAEMAREIKALVQNYVDDMTRTGGRLSRSGAR
jgi:hypothetical protein